MANANEKKSSAEFLGVAFKDAVLRVVLSCGGEFDDEAERQGDGLTVRR